MRAAAIKGVYWRDTKKLWLAERVDLSPSTLNAYLDTLTRFLSGHNLFLIGRLHVLTFLSQYENPSSYNRNLYAIKTFFNWFSEFYQVDNPTKGLRHKREVLSEVRVLSEEEYQKILALEGRHRDVIIFLCNTGLRVSEFCGLNPDNYTDGSVSFVGKGRKFRTVPLNKTAQELSLKYGNKINFSKNRYNRYSLEYICKKIAKQAGIRPFSPHACRRTFCTRLLQRGAALQDVSLILGHSSVTITISRYYHPASLGRAVSLLD